MLKTKEWYDLMIDSTKDRDERLSFATSLLTEAMGYLKWEAPKKYDEFVRVSAARRNWEAVEYVPDKELV